MMSAIRAATALLLCCVLAGCGGGGGGGGGNNGGGLSVSPTSLTFTFSNGAFLPETQHVNATLTNRAAVQIGAGYAPGVTPANWLNVSLPVIDPPNYVFDFQASPNGLPAGTYRTTVSIGIADGSGNIIEHRDVAVTMTIEANLAVSPETLTFDYAIGAPAPQTQFVFVGGNMTVPWTASADQPWVSLGATSGTTQTNTNVGVDPTGLAPGHYTANIVFTASGQTRTVAVGLNVIAPAIAPSESQLSFLGINGATLLPQSMLISLNNTAVVPWTATSNAPWLVLSEASTTTPGVVRVSVDPSIGPLASGTHTGTISIDATYAGAPLHTEVPVTLNLTPATLTVSPSLIELGGADGGDLSSTNVELSLNTGEFAFPWSVSGLATGSQSSALSGTVSSVPVTLTMQPSTTVDGNTYTSTATFAATVNGDTITRQVPMTVRIKPHRLFVHDTGVALLSSPTLARLGASVTVRENRGLPAAWTATSDQPWLTLTHASGAAGEAFQMTANPASLSNNAISYANVTVTSGTPGVTNTEIVRVGLYKTSTAPPAQSTASVVSGPIMSGIVADPVRPYVYMSHGTTTVETYNIYTGALVQTFTADAGSKLGSLAVDDDGSRLYAADHGTISIRVFDIDAGTPAFIANWTDDRWSCQSCSHPLAYTDLDYTRINGRGVLIGGGLEIIDAVDGAILRPSDAPFGFFDSNWSGSVSGDGSTSFWPNLNSSGHEIQRKTQTFDELHDVVSFGSPPLSAQKDGASRGVTTDYPGSVVYRACWFDAQQIERYDGATLDALSVVDNGTNGGALFADDERVYCARYYDDFLGAGWPDVWAVDPVTGDTIAGHTYQVPDTVMERQYVISGDGLRLLTRSQATAFPPSGTLTSTTIEP